MVSDLLKAIAELIRAFAWPAVAVFASIYYRAELSSLTKRLRKGGPAEFDPPQQVSLAVTDASSAMRTVSKTASDALSNLPASPTTVHWEQFILNSEPLKNITAPAERELILTRITAHIVMLALFETTEANIWASQIELLHYLNSNRLGVVLSEIKTLFYDKAAQKYPEVFAKYAFDNYLGFLTSNMVIESDGRAAKITTQGIEYLSWRIEQAKPPRLFG